MSGRSRAALAWAIETFGNVALDPRERTLRFLEEALEVTHAMDIPASLVFAMTERVYAKPKGALPVELGQAQMTLEILGENLGVDVDLEAMREFIRVKEVPQHEWDRRHAAKQAIGLALPK